jgi:hypothetical protein
MTPPITLTEAEPAPPLPRARPAPSPPASRRRLRFFLRAATPALVVGLVWAAGEAVFHLVPNGYRDLARNAHVESWHVPGKSFFFWGSALGKLADESVRGNEVVWNREGFHDVDHAVAKPSRCARVVVLGDSFVEGVHVPTDALFHRRLEAALAHATEPPPPAELARATAPIPPRLGSVAGAQAEAMAFGWSGWGQEQELRVLRERARPYAPDLVLVGFLPSNDVRNNHPELEAIAGRQAGPLLPLANWLAFRRGLYFTSFVVDQANRAIRAMSREDAIDYDVYRERPASPELWDQAWARTDALIGRLVDEAASGGARLAVLVFTSEKEIRGVSAPVGGIREGCDFRRPARKMVEICARRGIPCLDLAPRFVARGGPDLARLHLPSDGHWTRTGHAWAAEETARFLVESGVWPEVAARAAAR